MGIIAILVFGSLGILLGYMVLSATKEFLS